MQTVYHAGNILEAHIVAGMLRAQGLDAQVGGHFLQGGVGELAPAGFATVAVDDADVDAARKLIEDYEQA